MYQPSLPGEALTAKCRICERGVGRSGLCPYHARALASLKKGYVYWSRAYLHITWKDYLQRVKAAEGTGRWVKEVAEMEESGASD